MRKRLLIALPAGGALIAAAAGFGALDRGAKPAAVAPPRGETAQVVKTELTESRVFSGNLGFGTESTLKGRSPGMITWLPKAGKVIGRGGVLYRADERPVVLFTGRVPLFRTLRKARKPLEGRDVEVLNTNLRALGHGAPAGALFTAETTAAVRRWQKALELHPTGSVAPGDVLVRPGKVRVSGLAVQAGDPATGDIMKVTSTVKSVGVPVEAAQIGAIRTGSRARITLPDGTTVKGRITAVGRIVSAEDGPPQLTVTVVPAGSKAITGLDAAAVQVTFVTAARKNVLAVPLAALIALREGGYGVQVKDGGLIAVETGIFAGGMVEITGVAEGTAVMVAA